MDRMPIYEYRCPKCGASEDRVVQLRERADADLPVCTACSEPMLRVPSLPAQAGEPVSDVDGTVAKRNGSYNYLGQRERG